MSAVDHDLRVHGIEGLLIADASVIPRIPSANTHATLIAEHASSAEPHPCGDLVLEVG
jgi:choline dehydrogenase